MLNIRWLISAPLTSGCSTIAKKKTSGWCFATATTLVDRIGFWRPIKDKSYSTNHTRAWSSSVPSLENGGWCLPLAFQVQLLQFVGFIYVFIVFQFLILYNFDSFFVDYVLQDELMGFSVNLVGCTLNHGHGHFSL